MPIQGRNKTDTRCQQSSSPPMVTHTAPFQDVESSSSLYLNFLMIKQVFILWMACCFYYLIDKKPWFQGMSQRFPWLVVTATLQSSSHKDGLASHMFLSDYPPLGSSSHSDNRHGMVGKFLMSWSRDLESMLWRRVCQIKQNHVAFSPLAVSML